MSRFRQLFNHRTDEDALRNLKTSDSDKDDCLIITPEPTKNRKCSPAKCSSQSAIKELKEQKEQKKDKLQHLKASKSDLTAKNSGEPAAANQSHFYLLINSEDADQPGKRSSLKRNQKLVNQKLVDQTLAKQTPVNQTNQTMANPTLDAQRIDRERAAAADDGRPPCNTTNVVLEANRKNSVGAVFGPKNGIVEHPNNQLNKALSEHHYQNEQLIVLSEHHYQNGRLTKPPEHHYQNGRLTEPPEHHYQNKQLISATEHPNQGLIAPIAPNSPQAVTSQSPKQQNRPSKETVKCSSFRPRPLKMIKKRLRKQKCKEFADPLNAQSNGANVQQVNGTNTQLNGANAQPNAANAQQVNAQPNGARQTVITAKTKNENSQNHPPPNSQKQLNSQINRPLPELPNSPLQERSGQHLNVSPTTTSSQRRRRQNQSFENLNDRLEYICASRATGASSSRAPMREPDDLKSGNQMHKSEDNLLHIVPSVPRSLSKMSANEKQFLRRVEEQLTSHQSRLADDQRRRRNAGDLNSSLPFFSENPSYTPFEQPERVDSELLAAMQRPNYVNDPSPLDELCARPRKADLISLRQLKPRRFLVPQLSVTCSDCDSKELIYVNLQFNDDDDKRDESNDRERSPSTSESSKISASSGSLADERKFAAEPSRTADRVKGDQMNGDLSKSTDLAVLRSTKPSSYKQSKSDDESPGKVEYCKIDFMATESLKNLTAIRIRNHHHLS